MSSLSFRPDAGNTQRSRNVFQNLHSRWQQLPQSTKNKITSAVAVAAIATMVALLIAAPAAGAAILLSAAVLTLAVLGGKALHAHLKGTQTLQTAEVRAVSPPEPPDLPSIPSLREKTDVIFNELGLEPAPGFWEVVEPILEDDENVRTMFENYLATLALQRVKTQEELDRGLVPKCPNRPVSHAYGALIATMVPPITMAAQDGAYDHLSEQVESARVSTMSACVSNDEDRRSWSVTMLIKQQLSVLGEAAALLNTQILENDLIPEGHIVSLNQVGADSREYATVGRFWKHARTLVGKSVPEHRIRLGHKTKSFWEANGRELITHDGAKLTLIDRTLTFEVYDEKDSVAKRFALPLRLSRVREQLGDKISSHEAACVHELFFLMAEIQRHDAFFANDDEQLDALFADWKARAPFALTDEDVQVIKKVVLDDFLRPAYRDYLRAVGNFR